jgi:hypothetical protein
MTVPPAASICVTWVSHTSEEIGEAPVAAAGLSRAPGLFGSAAQRGRRDKAEADAGVGPGSRASRAFDGARCAGGAPDGLRGSARPQRA